MSLDTYANLKTEVANWLERSGDSVISSNVVVFIHLAESRINRDLRLNAVEAESTPSGSVGSRTLTLPSGFIEPMGLWLTTNSVREPLRQFIAGTEPFGTTNGVPSAWCIDGTGISLDVPCDAAHTFAFRYRGKLTLSDSATTNSLLTNHPDIYLAATLVEAFAFLHDVENGVVWNSRYKAAVDEVNTVNARSKRVKLMVDPMLSGMGRGGYNINADA